LRAYNAAKCDCGLGSAPDPAGESYRAPQDSLASFKGDRFAEDRGTKKRGNGKVKGEEGQGGSEKGGEGRLTLMCSWNRAAD